MELRQNDLESVIVATLAVNLFSLEKAFSLLPAFQSEGILQPERVAEMDVCELIGSLERAGFKRGALMGMMAERYQAVMKEAAKGTLDTIGDLIRKGDPKGAKDVLLKVKGIGPTVAENAIMLISSVK